MSVTIIEQPVSVEVTQLGVTNLEVSQTPVVVVASIPGTQGPPGPGTTDHLLLSNIGTNSHVQIDSHIASTANPHSVTKSQVGLSNADNTSDANKPVSTATQTALNLKADDNSVVKLTGNQTVAGAKTFTDEIRRLSTLGSAHIEIDAPLASDAKDLQFRTAGLRRFTLRVDGGADNLTIRRYDDLGVFLDTPISINRATGAVTVNGETMSQKLNDPLTTNGDIIYRAAGITTRLPVGSENQELKVVSGSPAWQNPSPIYNPSNSVQFFDDFIGSTAVSAFGWSVSNSGTGSSNISSLGGVSSIGALGVYQFVTGTTNVGRSCNFAGQQAVLPGQGIINYRWRVRLPDASDAGNTYTVYIGLGDNTAAGDMVDGVHFQYTHTLNGGNWTLVTANNSTRTLLNSGIAFVPNVWLNLGATINAGGTSVEFFINGVSAGTIATNIPTAAGRETGPLAKIQKSVGATSRLMQLDYFYMDLTPTTPR